MMEVAKTTQKPREMAMGMRNWAWTEVSRMIGVRPPKVVRGSGRWVGSGGCWPGASRDELEKR